MSKAEEVYSLIKGSVFALEGESKFENVMKNTFKEREFSKKDKEELFKLINPEFIKELGLTKVKFVAL